MKNLVLVGLMGCGKSTVGRIVAKRFKMSFLDMDEELEKRYGPIPDLFLRGESYFRDLESSLAEEISKMSGMVVSTGGGIVLRTENIKNLKQNGVILFLDRPLKDILSDIDTSKRPLLKDGPEKLIVLYQQRYPIYMESCDFRVDSSKPLQHVVLQIRAIWNKVKKDT